MRTTAAAVQQRKKNRTFVVCCTAAFNDCCFGNVVDHAYPQQRGQFRGNQILINQGLLNSLMILSKSMLDIRLGVDRVVRPSNHLLLVLPSPIHILIETTDDRRHTAHTYEGYAPVSLI